MQLYQWANVITATACALSFLVIARRTKDRILKGAKVTWAICMVIAALQGPVIAFTDYDAIAQQVGRFAAPIGWTALAIMAARRVALGG